ncbi:HAD-like domain-containing protein [Pyronema domesticum]|uniref:Mitochondrial import inner membrane translocase subunit TIM50 n=1 Tax=Pyronema omphalodes (strain CBS 100304) TaxID=1076935 RepID=U4LG06_PYROM|nr:HAD-like domain-containing protein [Pyronema domesticum]CCX14387.1 Similar to Mitochondrial import inner membrane translocase subunit tim-50; acc. no. Q874C1 [Pyronema omphalodes CBS 100304]
MLARTISRTLLKAAVPRTTPLAAAATASKARTYSSKVPPNDERIFPSDAAASEGADPAAATKEIPLGEEEAPRSRGKTGGDGLPRSAYISSTDRRRNAMAKYFAWATLAGVVGGGLYLGRELEDDEKAMHPTIGEGWDQFFSRASARISDLLSFYNEPPFEKLLPDPVPEYGRPYTLVLSFEDLMIHSGWTREHGWRTAKRPGLDYFLAYLFQYYEIVVFTNQPEAMAAPLLQKVDQQPGYIMFPLFRAHTRYVDGKYIKDLNYLNRDLSKVVMIETNPDAWSANPDNTIKLPPWKGDATDRDLVALIPFLEYIAAMGVPDVRKVIKDFDGTHIPTEFARREELIREQLRKELGNTKGKKKGPPSWALGVLGMKPKEDEGDDVKTFMDIARERGQQNYLETQKHLAEHKEELLREQQQAEKEMAEQMKTSLSKIFTEGLPKAPGQP